MRLKAPERPLKDLVVGLFCQLLGWGSFKDLNINRKRQLLLSVRREPCLHPRSAITQRNPLERRRRDRFLRPRTLEKMHQTAARLQHTSVSSQKCESRLF